MSVANEHITPIDTPREPHVDNGIIEFDCEDCDGQNYLVHIAADQDKHSLTLLSIEVQLLHSIFTIVGSKLDEDPREAIEAGILWHPKVRDWLQENNFEYFED